MDAATTIALAIAGLLSPAVVQVTKQYVPQNWRAVFALGVALVIGVVSVAVTGGFHSTTVAVALAAVIGVSQAIYASISKVVDGSKAAAAKVTTTETASEATQTGTPAA